MTFANTHDVFFAPSRLSPTPLEETHTTRFTPFAFSACFTGSSM